MASNYLNYGERVSGKIYIIIPPNDAVLAVAPKEDVWCSFTYLSAKTGIDNMNGVNKSILSFLSFFYNFIIDKKLMDKTVSMSLNLSLIHICMKVDLLMIHLIKVERLIEV